jgi:hypothetical protein
MLTKKINIAYSEDNMKHTNTLCGQNAELQIVEGGTYPYYWD